MCRAICCFLLLCKRCRGSPCSCCRSQLGQSVVLIIQGQNKVHDLNQALATGRSENRTSAVGFTTSLGFRILPDSLSGYAVSCRGSYCRQSRFDYRGKCFRLTRLCAYGTSCSGLGNNLVAPAAILLAAPLERRSSVNRTPIVPSSIG